MMSGGGRKSKNEKEKEKVEKGTGSRGKKEQRERERKSMQGERKERGRKVAGAKEKVLGQRTVGNGRNGNEGTKTNCLRPPQIDIEMPVLTPAMRAHESHTAVAACWQQAPRTQIFSKQSQLQKAW